MRISQALSRLQTIRQLEDPPQFIVFHCGGNDIGAYSLWDLRYQIKYVLRNMIDMFPNTKIIWSQILPRKNWRYSRNEKAMERSRCRVNSAAATETIRSGGGYIKYMDIKYSLLADDGVHLSSLGYEVFLNTIQGALESFIDSSYTVVFPY